MLLNFADEFHLEGCVPYDEISSIREGRGGYGYITLKNKEKINTNMKYADLHTAYEEVIDTDLAFMMGDDEDDEEDV